MVKLFVENLIHYVTLLYWGVWLSILSYYQICWILNIGYSHHYDGFCVSWLSVGCCWLYRYWISANFHSKSIADNTIDIALKKLSPVPWPIPEKYRRYHRYRYFYRDINNTANVDGRFYVNGRRRSPRQYGATWSTRSLTVDTKIYPRVRWRSKQRYAIRWERWCAQHLLASADAAVPWTLQPSNIAKWINVL